jgi:hypothetical protein
LTGTLVASSATASLPVSWARARYRKSTATPARLESTRMVAASRPQPPIQPSHGPKALETQVKVVPESGIARLSCR